MTTQTEYRELEETLTQALHERSIECLELHDQIRQLKKENDDYNTQVKNLANIISNRVNAVDTLAKEKDQLRTQVKELKQALQDRERELIARNF